MTQQVISTRIEAEVSGYISALRQAATATKELADKAKELDKQTDQLVEATEKQGETQRAAAGAAEELGTKTDRVTKLTKEQAKALRDAQADGTELSEKQRKALADFDDQATQTQAAWDGLSNSALLVGGALAAGVGVAVKSYADFDKQMSAVASTGDDARRNLDALTEAALEAGATTAFSATEAAEGVENLLKAGVSASDVMGGGLKGALDLAAAGGTDVAFAAETAATALTQFKLTGRDVPHVADLLAAGAGKAQGDVADLGEALKQSGLVASQFGLSIEETTGGLAAFASAGLLGSDAGTSLKTMLLALANPAGETARQMTELGISAYDAQGNFIGLEALAGVLQTRLKDLTQEQRDQALAQIFGNDAVRAANVLYEEGADGIAAWTSRVNDAGYASDTAATRLDNLSGDLEALGGALETALIGAGEGADGPLRKLVQGVTDLVNAFTELPAPVQQGTVIVAAAGAAGLVAAAGVVKAVGAVAELKTNFTQLAPAGGRARGAIAGVGRAAAAASVALAITTAAVYGLEEAFGGDLQAYEAATSLEEVKRKLDALSGSAQQGTADLNALFQDASGGFGSTDLVVGVNDVASAFDRLYNRSGFTKLRDGLDIIGKKELSYVTDAFDKLDAAMAGLDPDKAAEGFRRIQADAEAQGVAVSELVELFPQYKAQLAQQAEQFGINNLSAADYAAWMGGSIPPAVRAAQEAAASAGDATGDLAAEMNQAAVEAEAATKAFYKAAQAQLQLSGSAIGVEAAYDDATAALKENGKTLDISTEKGRTNKSALNNLAAATLEHREALEEAGASTKEVTKATESGRKKFIEVAQQMGMTKAEAKKLAEQYGLVPKKIETKVTTPGMSAADTGAKNLRERILNIPGGKEVKLTAHFDTNAETAVADIKKTFSINGGPKFSAYADGGAVQGTVWQSQGVDRIPAMLDHDEHVLTRREVRALGGHAAVERMRAAALAGSLPAFREGGPVSPRFTGWVDAAHDPLARRSGDFFSALTRAVKSGMEAAIETLSTGMVGGKVVPLGGSGRVSLRGHTFTENFANRILKAEQLAGRSMIITQGGFRPTTSYSGTSHAGDALDIAGTGYRSFIVPLRRVGIATGDRAGLGNWIDHAHGVPLPGAGQAGGSAVWQAQDYIAKGGMNQSLNSTWGLAGGGYVAGSDLGLDRYPFLLAGGEYVVPADVTAQHRTLLDQMTYGATVERRYLSGASAPAPQQVDMGAIAATLAGQRIDYGQLARAIWDQAPRSIQMAGMGDVIRGVIRQKETAQW